MLRGSGNDGPFSLSRSHRLADNAVGLAFTVTMDDRQPLGPKWRHLALLAGVALAIGALILAARLIHLPPLNDPNFACYDLAGHLHRECVLDAGSE